jgi:hypothetical protein
MTRNPTTGLVRRKVSLFARGAAVRTQGLIDGLPLKCLWVAAHSPLATKSADLGRLQVTHPAKIGIW